MVKLFCDRCGAEIVDRYYTFSFMENSLLGEEEKASYSTTYSHTKKTAYKELCSVPMYCSNCKDRTLDFLILGGRSEK